MNDLDPLKIQGHSKFKLPAERCGNPRNYLS